MEGIVVIAENRTRLLVPIHPSSFQIRLTSEVIRTGIVANYSGPLRALISRTNS